MKEYKYRESIIIIGSINGAWRKHGVMAWHKISKRRKSRNGA